MADPMTDTQSMTLGEAEAYRKGFEAARERAVEEIAAEAVHIPHLKARDYPDDMGRLVDDIIAAIRAMEPPA